MVENKEIWAKIDDYPNYEVSSEGRVRNIKVGRVLKASNNNEGYLVVNLYKDGKKKKMFLIHRLVATVFILNPENKRTVNHIDGDKTNNRVENLEWCTDSENIRHAYKTGLRQNPKQRVRCIETGQEFESQLDASEYFGCGQGSIQVSINKRCRCKGYHFELI